MLGLGENIWTTQVWIRVLCRPEVEVWVWDGDTQSGAFVGCRLDLGLGWVVDWVGVQFEARVKTLARVDI